MVTPPPAATMVTMNVPLYRRLLLVTIVLGGLVAGLWFLPRTVSSGSPTPPEPIELRSAPRAEASPTPTLVRPAATADDGDAADDGAAGDGTSAGTTGTGRDGDDADDRDDRADEARRPRRADLRGQGAAPAPGAAADRSDDDDDDGDDDADDHDDAGDDDGDDDDD